MGAGEPWLLVQHVAFEGPGAIAQAITDAGRRADGPAHGPR